MKDLAEHVDDVEILYDLEETSRSVAKLHQRLAQTDTCTVLDGWIPEIVQDAVEEIRSRFGTKAVTYASIMKDLKMPDDGRDMVRMPSLMYQ